MTIGYAVESAGWGAPAVWLSAPLGAAAARGSPGQPQAGLPAVQRRAVDACARRGGRKRAIGVRSPLPLPGGPNQRWSLDFVHDQMTDGRRLRILAVVDDYTRECLVLVADTSISGIRVARELDKIIAVRGRPGSIVSDNGTELTSTAILAWSDRHKIGITSPQ